jgi:EmrB/QacA subfamily drug resistance transporter
LSHPIEIPSIEIPSHRKNGFEMRKWLPLTAVCLGTFMLLIDVTIVNVALPQMAIGLKTSFTSLQWVVDIYALVLAALLLGAGALGDIVGRRAVYVGGLVLFAASSLVCGIAGDPTELIVARAVQGVGAAAMFATTVALLNVSYQGRERGIAYGVWGAVSAAAAATGPIVGGVLTADLSWRWIFFVNLPVSVLAVVLSLIVFTGGRGDHVARIDLPGMVTFTVFASLLTYALIRSSDAGTSDASTIGLLAGAAAALAAFLLIERVSTAPMVDLSLFRDRRFVGAMLAALVFSMAAFSYLTYASIWLQSVLGLSPIRAGLVFLPMSVTSFVVSGTIGRRLNGLNPRWIIAIGLVLIGAGGFGQAVVGPDDRWPSLLAGLFVAGLGVGLVAPTLTAAVMASVPHQRGGMASGAMNTLRQLGFALGIAVLGTVFQSRVAHVLAQRGVHGSDAVATAVSGGATGAVVGHAPVGARADLTAAIHAAFASGLDLIFALSGAVAVVAGLAVMVLLRPLPVTDEGVRATGAPAAPAPVA